MNPVPRSSLPALLSRTKLPTRSEEGIFVPLSLSRPLSSGFLFEAVIGAIGEGCFEEYLCGSVYYPHPLSFREIAQAPEKTLLRIFSSYGDWFRVEERNHLTFCRPEVAYFYYKERDSRTPFIHLYRSVLFDRPRLRAILQPYFPETESTLASIEELVRKRI